MMRIDSHKVTWSAALGAFGAKAFLSTAFVSTALLGTAVLGTAPSALAEPELPPAPPPAPTQAAPLPAEQDGAVTDQAAPLATRELPHLPSPDNLPPGATAVPVGPAEGHGISYLRELWHAVQTQEVSGSGALLLLTQRPMNPDARPPAGMSAGPAGTIPAPPVPEAPPVPAPVVDPVVEPVINPVVDPAAPPPAP